MFESEKMQPNRQMNLSKNGSPPSFLWIVALTWLLGFLLYTVDALEAYNTGTNYLLLCIFMAFQLVALGLAAKLKPMLFAPVVFRRNSIIKLFVFSFAVNLILLPINIGTYTGASIWDIPYLMINPLEAYRNLQGTLEGGRGERADLLVIKLLLSWLIFAFIPFAIILFKEGIIRLEIFVAAILISFIFSIARGTDKEIFDIVILAFCSYFLPTNRMKSDDVKPKPNKKKKIVSYIVFVVGITLAVSIFAFRKSERLVDRPVHCFAGTAQCTNVPDSGSEPLSFLGHMGYRYLSHGFNGLAVSFDADYDVCPLIGHSRPIQYGASLFGIECSYTLIESLDSVGWTSRGAWSTGFVQLGNDFGIWLVMIQIFLIAFTTKSFHASAKLTNCYISKSLFLYGFYTLIYMIGNLQIAQSGDIYYGYLFWVFMVLFKTAKDGRPRPIVSSQSVRR